MLEKIHTFQVGLILWITMTFKIQNGIGEGSEWFSEATISRALYYHHPKCDTNGYGRWDIMCWKRELEHRQTALCTYFGDCESTFAPLRMRERIPPGTFSCYDGIYIIDKCPSGFNDERIKTKCDETNEKGGLSLANWPVRETTNDLIYKNVFCAACHGLNVTSVISIPAETEQPQVEWFIATAVCGSSAGSGSENLQEFITRFCDVHFIMERLQTANKCFPAVRSCASASNETNRIKNLCNHGPSEYVQRDRNGTVYKNQYCAACNWFNSTSELVRKIPDYSRTLEPNTTLYWNNSISTLQLSKIDGQKTKLLYLKLTPTRRQVHLSSSNNLHSFPNYLNFTCSFPANSKFDLCYENRVSMAYNMMPQRGNFSYSIWDLGSALCASPQPKVCEEFVLTSSAECNLIGCPVSTLPLIEQKTCLDISDLPQNQYANGHIRSTEWPGRLICEQFSSCSVKESNRSCHCDDLCPYYGDCCHDSANFYQERMKLVDAVPTCFKSLNFQTYDGGFHWSYLQIDKCPKDFTDQIVKSKCESPETWIKSSITIGSPYLWPVSDNSSGVRYRNIYCAECHSISAVTYWTEEIGCIQIDKDICAAMEWKVRQMSDFQSTLLFDTLSINVSAETFHQPFVKDVCETRQFLPPEGLPVRHCRLDHVEYFRTCPSEYSGSSISDLCENSPTSFIYEPYDVQPEQSVPIDTKNYFPGRMKYNFNYPSIEFHELTVSRKFRNSYCAACHGMVEPVCGLRNTVYFPNPSWDDDLYTKYLGSTPHNVFVYRLDLNNQICEFDSDYYITSHQSDGKDSCAQLQVQIRQCGNMAIFDIGTMSCVPVGISLRIEEKKIQPISNISAYASRIRYCAVNDSARSVDSTGRLNINCSNTDLLMKDCGYFKRCSWPRSRLVIFSDCIFNRYRNIKPNKTFSKVPSPKGSPAFVSPFTDNLFEIPMWAPDDTLGLGSLFALQDPLFEGNRCQRFISSVNDTVFCVTQTGGLQDIYSGEKFSAYYLHERSIYVCTEALKPFENFKIHVYDYILIGMSLFVIVIYMSANIIRGKWTITEAFFCNLLAALLLALLSFCLSDLPRIDTSACVCLAASTQYFVLCTHTWTAAFALWIYRGLSKIKLASESSTMNYFKYGASAWLTPFVPVIIMGMVHHYQVQAFMPVLLERPCFLGSFNARLTFFLGPIYLMVLINIALCIMSCTIILRAAPLSKRDHQRTKKNIMTCCKLIFSLGVHWLLIIFLEIPNSQSQLQTVLKILIELQGVTVIFIHVLKVTHFNRIQKRFRRSTSSSCSVMESSSSSGEIVMNTLSSSGNYDSDHELNRKGSQSE